MAVSEHYGPGGAEYPEGNQLVLGSQKLSGAYFLYCGTWNPPSGDLFLARLMFMEAGSYVLRYYVDDRVRFDIGGVTIVDNLDSGGSYLRTNEDPHSAPFTINQRGVLRFDVTYRNIPADSPAWVIFSIYDAAGSLVYASRAQYWSCGSMPPDDADLDPEGARDPAIDQRLLLPVWLNYPNWESGITEALEWQTWIGTSESGAEQRVAQRRFPRRSFEAQFRGIGDRRALLQQALVAVAHNPLLLPLWMYRTRIDEIAPEGTTSLFGDFALRQFVADEPIILRSADDYFDYELTILREVRSGELITTTPLQKDWPAGTTITPVRVCRVEDQPSLLLRTASVADTAVRFTQVSIERQPVDLSAFDAHPLDGLPVLGIRHNWREEPTGAYGRQVFVLDNQQGLPDFFDVGGQSTFAVNWQWQTRGIEELDFLRHVLYHFKGRQRLCWVPSLSNDITVVEPVVPALGEVTVNRFGYAQYGGVYQDIYRHIVFVMVDGSVIYNQVVSSRTRGDLEVLSLADNLERPYRPEDFLRVLFISRARLNADRIEIHHHTDAEGVQETALPVLHIENRR